MNYQYAVVELTDGTISSIKLTKYLASKMKIIEECDKDHLEEKVAYWNKIYNYKPQEDDLLPLHYVDKKRNRHLWATSPKALNRVRHRHDYELVS